MEAETLSRMANQIAAFFVPYGHDSAVESTADHLRKFWTPVMRAQLIAQAEGGDALLQPIVVAAAQRLKL